MLFPHLTSRVLPTLIVAACLSGLVDLATAQEGIPNTAAQTQAPAAPAPPPPSTTGPAGPAQAPASGTEQNSSQTPVQTPAQNEEPPSATSQAEQANAPRRSDAPSLTGNALAIVVDTSRTDRTRYEELRKGLDRFVRSLPEGQEACIYSASDEPKLEQDITDNRDELTRAIRRLKSHGKPAVQQSVSAAAQHLRSAVASDGLAIVIFTPSRNVTEPNMEDSIAALRDGKPITLSAVAGPGAHWQLQEQLQRLAVKTGGFAYFPPRSGDVPRVAEAAARKFGSDSSMASGQHVSVFGDSRRGGFSTIVVRRVPVADNHDTAEFQSGDDELLQQLLVARLQHDKLFRYVIPDEGNPDRRFTPPDGSKALELEASIVEYRRGNRMQRQLLGYMGGAKVKVNVILRDLASGRPLQAFMKEGASSSGIFGGTNEAVQSKALKEVVDNIVSEIKKYRRTR